MHKQPYNPNTSGQQASNLPRGQDSRNNLGPRFNAQNVPPQPRSDYSLQAHNFRAPASKQSRGWKQTSFQPAKIPESKLTPFQVVNEKQLEGIFWECSSFPAADGPRDVHISICRYGEAEYRGVGRTRTDAVNDAAKYLLKALDEPVPYYVQECPAEKKDVKNLQDLLSAKKHSKMTFVYNFEGPVVECTTEFAGITYFAYDTTRPLAKMAVASRVWDLISSGQINEDAMEVPSEELSAVSRLTLKVGGIATLHWKYDTVFAHTSSGVMHIAHLTVCGLQFSGHGVRRDRARNDVARCVLNAIEKGVLVLPNRQPTADMPLATHTGEDIKQPVAVKRPASDVEGSSSVKGDTDKQEVKEAIKGEVHEISDAGLTFSSKKITCTFEISGPPHQPQVTCKAFLQGGNEESMLLANASVELPVKTEPLENVKSADNKVETTLLTAASVEVKKEKLDPAECGDHKMETNLLCATDALVEKEAEEPLECFEHRPEKRPPATVDLASSEATTTVQE